MSVAMSADSDEADERGPLAILFDIDGTLISTGGAGTRSWRWAFEKLHGIPADIGAFSETGMTDPTVARRTFRGAVGREPTERELARLLVAYVERLPEEVETSEQYRVLPGAEKLLERGFRAVKLRLGYRGPGSGGAYQTGACPVRSILRLRRIRVGFRRPQRADPPGDRARRCDPGARAGSRERLRGRRYAERR